MRVIQVAQFGGPEVLTPGEAPDPVAGPGEAVIAVSAADVRGIDQVQFAPADLKRLADRALSDAVAGKIKPVVGQTFPLRQAATAHAAMEARSVIGKSLLLI